MLPSHFILYNYTIQVQIQNAYHQGEQKIYGYLVDGYAVVDGIETVWEYNGCIYHGCDCIKNRTDEQIARQQKWIERKARLEVNGCKVIEMTCCRWRKMLRFIRRNPPQTQIGRVLCLDTQEKFTFDCIFIHFIQLYKL